MLSDVFNPLNELNEVKERRALLRRKLFRRSKLEKYRSELVALRQAGGSSQDLATWLKMKHRLKIHRSSIDRYLSGLPELATPPQLNSEIEPAAEVRQHAAVE